MMKEKGLTETLNSKISGRIWELDFLRGIALILMVYFHTIYDLKEIYNYPISYTDGVNFYIGKVSAILFILISGVSCSLSKSNARRGLKVLVIAMLLTIITHLYGADYGVKFGILHFLGLSMLLAPIFMNLNKYVLAALGLIVIFTGNFVSAINTPTPYLFPLGITNGSFYSADYYPLIPWLGIFLFGLSLGKFLYTDRLSIFPFQMRNNPIIMVGQNTLLIYLLHQPLILLLLMLIQYLH